MRPAATATTASPIISASTICWSRTAAARATLAVRAGSRADPSLLSTARLDVQTAPLIATLGGAGDNRAAQALAEALSAPSR